MKKIITILLIIFCLNAFSEEERWINFDWDPIENATSYEVELLKDRGGQLLSIGIFITETAEWNKAVVAGKYYVRLRALDKRKVPGDWSEKHLIVIKGRPTELLIPKYDEVIEVEQGDGHNQHFSWKPTEGAQAYKIQFYNSEEKLLAAETVTENNFSYRFDKPGLYFWNVSSLLAKEDLVEDNLIKSPFRIIYGQLLSPDLKIKTTKENLIFSWTKIINATEFSANIYLQNNDGTFNLLDNYKTKDLLLTFPKKLFKKGSYKVTLKASGTGYLDSNENEIIYEYDLEEIKVIIEKSGEDLFKEKRVHGNYLLEGLYAVPSLSYIFKNFEEDTIGNQSLSGTSLDITYKNLHTIPYIHILDLFFKSNLRIMNISDTYSSSVFAALSSSFESRFNYKTLYFYPSLGIFIEKTPLFIINRLDTSKATSKDAITLGPQLTFLTDYYYKNNLTLFAGQKLMLHTKQLSGLDGNIFQSSMETEFTFGIKYIFKTYLDLMLKYSINNYSFKSLAKTGGASYASPGDVNNLEMSGSILAAGVVWYF
jgi:hypothetical protein